MELCNNCIAEIINKLSKDEMLLLNAMKKNKIINAQMSSDENSLVKLVKGLTLYKIRKILGRLTLIGFIESNKFGATKYYLTESGVKAVNYYNNKIKDLVDSPRIKEPKKKG